MNTESLNIHDKYFLDYLANIFELCRVHIGNCNTKPFVFINRLWIAKIMPSFHSEAAIAVLETEKLVRAAFVVAGSSEVSTSPFAEETRDIVAENWRELKAVPMDNWKDPVVSTLRNINLVHLQDSLTLDGIGYSLTLQTLAIDIKIKFANPRVPPLIKLQEDLISAAKEIANAQQDSSAQDYIQKIWRHYTGHPK